MGRYFNPATVQAIEQAGGRKLRGEDHQTLASQLGEGETIGMFSDRLFFKQVADVGDLLEFEEFESQYRQGTILSRSFYALPRVAFEH